jgi:ElaB/YqjD/DUF883 family membrane-anchored ribosome-binding protein
MTQQKAGISSRLFEGSADAGKDRPREMADGATDKFKNVTESAEEMAGKVAEQAREYGEKAQEAVKQFKPYVEKPMKEQPVATLGVAAVIEIGFWGWSCPMTEPLVVTCNALVSRAA